ncbi:hypothetical protein HUT06_21590 [Actinomadura sp. NAK00032]|uniref:hypothetical protein n=1 Tax=Actinomadura sp. NAK00032 TaxID=2742128 RepID=UPI001592AF06|nr:hypothetical protein [Actinomadura sp. NAK00032]QKW36304.1 hypothetical protein HUT06_21590 [Actinomadura sp. NAK00032]
MTGPPDAATGTGGRRRSGPAIPARLTPQTRPTPTLGEAGAQTAALRARLLSVCPEHTDAAADRGRDGPLGAAAVVGAILAPGGLLDRYQRAAWHAAHPPHGLEQAWGLVAATLADVVTDLAGPWANHPDSTPARPP